MTRVALVLAAATALFVPGAGQPRPPHDPLPLSCEVFSPATRATELAARFGAANVKTGQVPWGGAEGDTNEGTVLLGDTPDAKLEV